MGFKGSHVFDRAEICGIMQRNESRLRKSIAQRIGNNLKAEIDVDDILQEVYFEVFQSIDKLALISEFQLENWMLTVANNRIWDRIKARSRL
jgi:DNA-directed RNA polymerase specialized sigma24 family protein